MAVRLPPVYEVMASAASPVINFGRGILGYQDPFLTQTMQDRMLELEAQKGPSGSIGYEDYGLPVSTPGGRFTGGLPSLLLSNPIDFGLAGSVGRYGYGPEGRTGLEYDFTPDQDTGSTGNVILDFINRGGLKNAISRMGTAQASEVTPQSEPLVIEDWLGTSTPQDLGFINSAPSVFTPTPTEYTAYTPSVEMKQAPKKPLGIESLLESALSYLPFGEKSLLGYLGDKILPKESPEVKGMKRFYRDQYGLDPVGRVASGIMAGYNPVSGGLLNMLTGGAYGKPTRFGLAGAMQKRIENILGRKAPQTDASRARVEELRNLQLKEMQDRADRGESLSSIGKSTFSGKGKAFEAKPSGAYSKGFAGGR